MKVYGHPMSTCTRKVLTTLIETQTPYELVLLDFATGDHKQPAHLARQPFGQMPAIDDDGFALYESRAIIRYINEKTKGNLAPADLQGRARMEQWISIETSNFTPHAMKLIYHHVFQWKQDEATLATAREKMDVALGIMDAHLAANPYFAGATFSLADISFMPYFEFVTMTPAKGQLLAGSHVAAWWNRVSERPSWRKIAGRA
jgi:glutathione S-transferase